MIFHFGLEQSDCGIVIKIYLQNKKTMIKLFEKYAYTDIMILKVLEFNQWREKNLRDRKFKKFWDDAQCYEEHANIILVL